MESEQREGWSQSRGKDGVRAEGRRTLKDNVHKVTVILISIYVVTDMINF